MSKLLWSNQDSLTFLSRDLCLLSLILEGLCGHLTNRMWKIDFWRLVASISCLLEHSCLEKVHLALLNPSNSVEIAHGVQQPLLRSQVESLVSEPSGKWTSELQLALSANARWSRNKPST